MRTVWIILLVAGFSLITACEKSPYPVSSSPTTMPAPAAPFPVLSDFNWGNAHITVGMTRPQVLTQIAKSGLPEYDGKFGIDHPTDEIIPKDTWHLSCGNGSGAAPGGGLLTIRFENGRVVEIIFGPVYA